jgi:hypothetical protein
MRYNVKVMEDEKRTSCYERNERMRREDYRAATNQSLESPVP